MRVTKETSGSGHGFFFLFRAEETLDETVVMLQRCKVTGVGSPSVSFHVDALMDSI